MAQKATHARRAMFVWLPNFAMTLARLKEPAPASPQEPFVLVEKSGSIRRIAALDGPASEAGLRLHQPLADALAVYPELIFADAAPEASERALKDLALWAQRYSPSTAPAPSGLWLDITGCAHLWGGEAELCEDLLCRLEARKIACRAAIAPTFGAAYALALHAKRFVIVPDKDSGTAPGSLDGIADLGALLAPLPPERLRIGEATASLLRKLGIFTIGAVQKLPRAGLARRFPDLLLQLDKATGAAGEAIDFMRPPASWTERMRFAEPISALEDLERVAAHLLEKLCIRFEAARQGGLTFELVFFRADGGVETQAVSAALPTRDARRIMRLFREKLGLIDPGFGIDAAMLAVPHTEPLAERQSSILRNGQSAACVEELAALIDALENRLGKGRVHRLTCQESYIPERAVKRMPPLPSSRPSPIKKKDDYARAGEAVWQHLGERPIRLFARPQPIDVTAALPDAPPVLMRWRKVLHRIARAEGPERIAPEWWRGGKDDESAGTRDYYRVESTAGLRFWVFREGIYGGSRHPRWFLHGLFP